MSTQFFSGKLCSLDNRNRLYIDGEFHGTFKGLKEAREYCEGLRISAELAEELREEADIPQNRIIQSLLEEFGDRISQGDVSHYKQMAENKAFYPSKALKNIREMMSNSSLVGKLEFILTDGSKVMIDSETMEELNSLDILKENEEFLEYMVSSSKNFLICVERLLEE